MQFKLSPPPASINPSPSDSPTRWSSRRRGRPSTGYSGCAGACGGIGCARGSSQSAANSPSGSPTRAPGAVRPFPLVLFSLSSGCFPLLLQLLFAPLRGLLSQHGFILYIRGILCRPLPAGVQDQSLVVFGLRKDPGPGIEEGRGGIDCPGHGLEPNLAVIASLQAPNHTSMFPFAESRLVSRPSITPLIFRTLCNSPRNAASRASSRS